ncbi:MAG: hypothetical protein HC829_05160 [Bacteroidales bacterium]|nr:hypothetical protein [Bacteroidales bacterium]
MTVWVTQPCDLPTADKDALIAALMARNEALIAQNEALMAEVARLAARVGDLEAKLGPPPKTPNNRACRRRRGRSPPAHPPRGRKPSRIRAHIGRCTPTRPPSAMSWRRPARAAAECEPR